MRRADQRPPQSACIVVHQVAHQEQLREAGTPQRGEMVYELDCARIPPSRAAFARHVRAFLFMPDAPKRPCTWPGCGALTRHGRCPAHKRVVEQQSDRERGSAHQRGYGARWRKASAAFIRAHPLCQCNECQEGKLRTLPSQVTDHRIPHRGDMRLFWDSSNWQAMNKACHDRKTATEDGGFGNPQRGGVV